MMNQNHEMSAYLPWIGTAVAVAYAVYLTIKSKNAPKGGCDKVNLSLKKDIDKVVDTFDIEDLDKKAVFCRCWRSNKFPYCDGSHNKHNETTGDNIGPLIVQRKGA